MLTIKYNEIDLTVHQQSPQVSTKQHGYNGRLVIEPEYNRAYFTETMREPAAAGTSSFASTQTDVCAVRSCSTPTHTSTMSASLPSELMT